MLHVVSILCTLVWTQYKYWMDSENCEAVHYAEFFSPNLITCQFFRTFCSRRIVSFIWVRFHACALQRTSLRCIVCWVVYVYFAISVSRLSHILCLPPVSHTHYLLGRTLLNNRPTVDTGNAAAATRWFSHFPRLLHPTSREYLFR